MRLRGNTLSTRCLTPRLTRFCPRRFCLALLGIGLCGLLGGCDFGGNDFINPSEPYILDTPGHTVPILDTVAPGVEEPDEAYSQATDIEPDDLVPNVTDYRIAVDDVINIGIQDLQGEGTGEQIKTVRVTETGMVNLPYISPVKAEGLTELELQDAVVAAYENAKMIQHAQVTVTVAQANGRTYKILGNVGNPGEYAISKPDFRMLDAMVAARAPNVTIGVDYAYVIRDIKAEQEQEGAEAPTTAPSDMNEAPTTTPSTNPGDLLNPQGKADAPPGSPVLMDDTTGAAASPPGESFQFNSPPEQSDTRVIRIPIHDLLQLGELKYNIVIRPGDKIYVPDPVNGVYYMGGHIQRSGVYSLSGTKITIKQAWVAAGGADQNAIPRRTEIIRRIGDNKEVFVRINMSKVWSGLQPDVFLKPDDTVEVGTDMLAPFITILRNAPSLTTGIGLSYQRNFYTGVNPL